MKKSLYQNRAISTDVFTSEEGLIVIEQAQMGRTTQVWFDAGEIAKLIKLLKEAKSEVENRQQDTDD